VRASPSSAGLVVRCGGGRALSKKIVDAPPPRSLRAAPADLRTQMHLSREGMHFYLSSLLGGKIHQQFAYPIGDRNHNAQYQFVKQKCKCMFNWDQSNA
jgi:hypothetical protein